MLIHEVCKVCGLTKKAVEYYVEQGLVAPSVQENGYRVFTAQDVERLRRIAVLRGLGVAIADIKGILSEQEGAPPTAQRLLSVSNKKHMELSFLRERQELIGELAQRQDWAQTKEKLGQLQRKESVLLRLQEAFPGNYGRYIGLHFARYLNEPAVTKEQQEAFDTIIAFLDTVDFDISEELRGYIDEAFERCDEAFEEGLSADMDRMLEDTEAYLEEHREAIADYMALKQSEAYRSTPAYQLEQALRQFQRTSGYEEVFLPAMRALSPAYREYHERLLRANEVFKRGYPDYAG
ncbi:MAG: MerR family transcriptional regulator [Roseburia sp.]|nr:MerR family transcriptional regulator [Roseburia sp.]